MSKIIRSISLPDAIITIPASPAGGRMTLYRLNNPDMPAPDHRVDHQMTDTGRYLELSITNTHTLLSLVLPTAIGFPDRPHTTPGALKITVAIPRNSILQKQRNLYDLLTDLRDTLFIHYMRPLPGQPGAYLPLAILPDETRLLQTLAQYPLERRPGPHRTMSGHDTVYLRTPRLEQLTLDLQYPEFEPHGKIIIAPSIPNGLPMVRVSDIPRRPAWQLLINGTPSPWPEDTDIYNDRIEIHNPDYDPETHYCNSVRFTIDEAIAGRVPGVDADTIAETVSVTLIPVMRRRLLKIRLTSASRHPAIPLNEEAIARNLVAHIGDSERFLDPDLTLPLIGEELRSTITFEYRGDDYRITPLRKGGEIEIRLHRIPAPRPILSDRPHPSDSPSDSSAIPSSSERAHSSDSSSDTPSLPSPSSSSERAHPSDSSSSGNSQPSGFSEPSENSKPSKAAITPLGLLLAIVLSLLTGLFIGHYLWPQP